MSEPAQDPPPDSTADWQALLDRIQSLLPAVQTPWIFQFPAGTEAEKLAVWTMTDLMNYGPVNDLLPALLRDGRCDETHQPYRYFLRARLVAAHRFVYQFVCRRRGIPISTIFPFPNKTQDEVLRWLLTEWWQWAGSTVAVSQLLDTQQPRFQASLS